MPGTPFVKGHPCYYKGKKIDNNKFIKYFNLYIAGAITKEEYAKLLGISIPTLNKHLKTLCETGELTDVFKDENAYVSLTIGKSNNG